jgi:hypothetical protein
LAINKEVFEIMKINFCTCYMPRVPYRRNRCELPTPSRGEARRNLKELRVGEERIFNAEN